MRGLGQRFIMGKSSHVSQRRWLVIQCHYPRFVSEVYQFSHTEYGEKLRREFLAEADPYTIAKADGHRLYVRCIGCLRPYTEPEGEDWKEDMKSVMKDMADFALEEMPGGKKLGYRDWED